MNEVVFVIVFLVMIPISALVISYLIGWYSWHFGYWKKTNNKVFLQCLEGIYKEKRENKE